MYLISVYFDDNSNKILQRYIDQIALKTGNHFMTEHKVPPHMTISSIEARSVSVLQPAFESLRGTLKQGEIQLVSVGQLLPYVIYTTPVMNSYLLELSECIYEAFKEIPQTSISRYYRPLSWLPHVTLGKTLDKDQMQKAFAVMKDSFAPFYFNNRIERVLNVKHIFIKVIYNHKFSSWIYNPIFTHSKIFIIVKFTDIIVGRVVRRNYFNDEIRCSIASLSI